MKGHSLGLSSAVSLLILASACGVVRGPEESTARDPFNYPNDRSTQHIPDSVIAGYDMGTCEFPCSENPGNCCAFEKDPVPVQDCSLCLGEYVSCQDACVATGYDMGTCEFPGSEDSGYCCACEKDPVPVQDCSLCLGGYGSCQDACAAGGYNTGSCGFPGSQDPGQCCDCGYDPSGAEWVFHGQIASGGQIDAVRGIADQVHLVSSRYYQINAQGSVIVDEDVGDDWQGAMHFPPAIAAGGDGTVHLVTRHGGNWNDGHNIRYRRRASNGTWDQDYNVGSPVRRNYAVSVAWAGPGQVFMSYSQMGSDVWGDIHVWQAGEGSASLLGSLGGIWRADADSRMRGRSGHVFLISGKPDGSGNAAYMLHGNPGANLVAEMNGSKQTHVAGGGRTGFPDLYMDSTETFHFTFGSHESVYYNQYTSSGQKVFANDKQVFSGLNGWHLSSGLSAVAASNDGSTVLAVALRSDGSQGATNSDLMWAYSSDGGSTWSAPADTGHNTDGGEGRTRPRLVAIGGKFFLFYRDTSSAGISMATITLAGP